mmetsp:Transcript_7918/g.23866  ORF Transcript_7918/g.23866 Transcript_7918/m.23866 type:complete len:173 (-) Transcript_7918:1153-1671(-)
MSSLAQIGARHADVRRFSGTSSRKNSPMLSANTATTSVGSNVSWRTHADDRITSHARCTAASARAGCSPTHAANATAAPRHACVVAVTPIEVQWASVERARRVKGVCGRGACACSWSRARAKPLDHRDRLAGSDPDPDPDPQARPKVQVQVPSQVQIKNQGHVQFQVKSQVW